MRLPPVFSRPRSSLSARLFLVLVGAMLVALVLVGVLGGRIWRSTLHDQVRDAAFRNSDFLASSLYIEMLENNRDNIHDAIRRLGNERGVVVIRIYNKRGVIAYSSDTTEIGRRADLDAEACVSCHAPDGTLTSPERKDLSRVYRRGGSRVLGLINPIQNDKSCWSASCHAHTPEQSVLGVLDVQMSLASVDAALGSATRSSVLALLAVAVLAALLVAFLVERAVHRPTRELITGTERLASGHLSARVELDREDELGQLAAAFNRMAASLERAQEELRDWSDTLAERVREKTRQLAEVGRQMLQVEKTASLGRMAATVAHELNNPLSGILTCSRLVARRVEREAPEGESKQKSLRDLELIRSEAVRCGRIVQDLLTYAREGSHEFEEARLNGLVERAANLVRHHTKLGAVELKTDLALADDEVVCDSEQIVQALLALSINAVEAMPEGGRLELRTRNAPAAPVPSVVFEVSDTGKGIPEEIRDRIFDPFFSTKNETKGVGLGLAVVFGIVRRHGGEISIDSAPGEGTTFHIRLPRQPTGASSRAGSGDAAVRLTAGAAHTEEA